MFIFVSGSIAYDTIISTVESFDESRRGDGDNYSYSMYAPRVVRQTGGTGHNVAYALGLLGHKDQTTLVGSVGRDFIIEPRLESVIDYIHVLHDDQSLTAGAYMTNDARNNQMIVFHPGAMSSGLHTIPDHTFDYAIITPNDKSIMISHVYAFTGSGATVFFDPGQALGLFSKEDLSDIFGRIDYLICNDEEAVTIAKLFAIREEELFRLCPHMIITRGPQGVSYYKEGILIATIPGYVTDQLVDPTGAGDALRGALLAGLLSGEDIETALGYGCILGSRVVAHQGTMNYHITMDELKEKYRLRKGE